MFYPLKTFDALEIEVPKDGQGEDSIAEIGFRKISFAEVSHVKSGSMQGSPTQIGSHEVASHQISSAEICPTEIIVSHATKAEIGCAKVNITEINTTLAKASTTQVRMDMRIPCPPLVPNLYTLLEQVNMFLVCHAGSLLISSHVETPRGHISRITNISYTPLLFCLLFGSV